jgi:hypothetical protein
MLPISQRAQPGQTRYTGEFEFESSRETEFESSREIRKREEREKKKRKTEEDKQRKEIGTLGGLHTHTHTHTHTYTWRATQTNTPHHRRTPTVLSCMPSNDVVTSKWGRTEEAEESSLSMWPRSNIKNSYTTPPQMSGGKHTCNDRNEVSDVIACLPVHLAADSSWTPECTSTQRGEELLV